MARPRSYVTYIVYFIVVFVIIHIVLLSSSNTDAIIYWPEEDGKIQCYSNVDNDALESVEDPHFSPSSKSIFFFDTSCRGGIDSRQACAVESAARTHSDWEVYLLFTAPVTHAMLTRSCLAKLLQYPNVKLARIHAFKFSNNTVVSQIVQRLQTSSKPVQLSANIMKMLILNKWGGVSLDLDVLVLRTFLDDLPINWVAKEFPDAFSGVMRFSKDVIGTYFTWDVLREIALYNETNWHLDGDLAIEQAMAKRCNEDEGQVGFCKGIHILLKGLFYPKDNQPYERFALCTWKRSRSPLIMPPDSVYVKIAKNVCPKIYQMYGDEFGV